MGVRLEVLFLIFCTAFGAAITPPETVQDLISRLSRDQRALWEHASQAFDAQQYAEALATFKQLLGQLLGDAILSKFASEAALNSGEGAFALRLLKPLAEKHPNDWQTISLLVRACAESGDVACRDSNMTHMVELHRQGAAPPSLRQYIVERVKVGDKTLFIFTSLERLGVYKIYDLGRLMDRNSRIFLRITIESGDDDQRNFAKEHPKEAAQGLRAFSLDAYEETGLNSNGQRTQTHFTYKFYVGQRSYEEVRQAFIDVAAGKTRPISSRSGLLVP